MPWMQLLKIIMKYKTEETQGRKWYRSKTLLSMGLTTLILILNSHFGLEIPSEVQVTILFVVGTVMRFVSKGAIGFYEDASPGTAKEVTTEDSPPEPSKAMETPTPLPPEKEKTPQKTNSAVPATKPFKPFNVSHIDGEH